MCFKKKKFTEYSISASDMAEKLEPLGLKQRYLWDRKFYYVSHKDWGEIFRKVLMDMPKYTTSKFDCENFALLASARTSEIYKINTCGIAIGQGPGGYHGFNIFMSDVGLHYLEPQSGMIYSIKEDSGYKAEIVIMG